MFIPYKTFREGPPLPFVRLTVKGPRKEMMTEAFVDSGADFSILHADWMDYLGLQKKNAEIKKIQVGDGDYIEAFLFQMEVTFCRLSFKAPLTFSDSLGPGFNLLGRSGFFNRFRFCFDDKHFRLFVTQL